MGTLKNTSWEPAPSVGSFLKLSYQAGQNNGVWDCFLAARRQVYKTSIEIGVQLVQGWYYLKFLPGKYYLYKAGIASVHTW